MKTFLMLVVVMFVVTVSVDAEQVPAGATAVVNTAVGIANAGFQEGPGKKTVFGDWYGMPNQAWCGSFVSWCFAKSNLVKLVAVQSDKGFSSCWIALAKFKEDKQVVPTGEARPGDLVFFHFGGGSRANHVGIVVENHSGDGFLLTCEGNTTSPKDPKGARGVYMKKRPINSSVVVRPKYD